jgi:hypothetical protein
MTVKNIPKKEANCPVLTAAWMPHKTHTMVQRRDSAREPFATARTTSKRSHLKSS